MALCSLNYFMQLCSHLVSATRCTIPYFFFLMSELQFDLQIHRVQKRPYSAVNHKEYTHKPTHKCLAVGLTIYWPPFYTLIYNNNCLSSSCFLTISVHISPAKYRHYSSMCNHKSHNSSSIGLDINELGFILPRIGLHWDIIYRNTDLLQWYIIKIHDKLTHQTYFTYYLFKYTR